MEEDFVGKCHYLKDSLVKNHRDSLRRSSGCELEIQKRKVPAAMCAIGKRKTTQGFFVLCLNRATAGGEEWRRGPGEERIREKKLLTAAQPEAQNMRRVPHHRVTSHPFSPVIILPLTEHTRRLSGTHMHTYTTAHCLRCLDLL